MTPLLLALSLTLAADESVDQFGFRSLVDDDDLSAWNIPEGDNGHWKAVDGVIDYDAGSEAEGDKSLYSKDSFGDFVLELDWRVTEDPPLSLTPIVNPDGSYLKDAQGNTISVPRFDADSGIYLRGTSRAQVNIWGWPVGSGEMYGFRHSDQNPPDLRAALTPRMNADNPRGEWNHYTIVLVGRRLTVLLNDQLIIDRAELPEAVPMEGPIALQHHGGRNADGSVKPKSSVVQFKNIKIRELPRAE